MYKNQKEEYEENQEKFSYLQGKQDHEYMCLIFRARFIFIFIYNCTFITYSVENALRINVMLLYKK